MVYEKSPLCALKSDCVDYIIWEGVGGDYPSWFIDTMSEEFLQDESGDVFYLGKTYPIWTNDPNFDENAEQENSYIPADGLKEHYIIPDCVVFIRNNYGEVRMLDVWDFNCEFIKFPYNKCALRRDTHLFFVWTSIKDWCPEWFVRHRFYSQLISSGGNYIFFNDNSECLLKNGQSFFIRNGRDVIHADSDTFMTTYFYNWGSE